MQFANYRNLSHRFGRSHRPPKRKRRSSHGVDKSYAAKFAAEPNVNFLTGQRFFGRNRRSFFGIWPGGKKAKCGPKKGQNRGYDTIICDNLRQLAGNTKKPWKCSIPKAFKVLSNKYCRKSYFFICAATSSAKFSSFFSMPSPTSNLMTLVSFRSLSTVPRY